MADAAPDPEAQFAELQTVLHELREAQDKLDEWTNLAPGDEIYDDIVAELTAEQDVDVTVKEQQDAAVSPRSATHLAVVTLTRPCARARRSRSGKTKSTVSRIVRPSSWTR